MSERTGRAPKNMPELRRYGSVAPVNHDDPDAFSCHPPVQPEHSLPK